jgi:hypothetical protein
MAEATKLRLTYLRTALALTGSSILLLGANHLIGERLFVGLFFLVFLPFATITAFLDYRGKHP